MLTQAQNVLSNSMAPAKALAGSHPVGLGIMVGLSAYYVVNKYWLNEESEESEEGENTEEAVESAENTA